MRENIEIEPQNIEATIENAKSEGIDPDSIDFLRKVLVEFNNKEDVLPPNLRYVDRKNVASVTYKVNNVLKYIPTRNITDTNRLLQAAANVTAEILGIKAKREKSKNKKEPAWRKRILCKVSKLRAAVSKLEQMKKGSLTNEETISNLEKEFKIGKKGLNVVLEEQKQRLVAISGRLKKYDQRNKQYHQNRLFQANRKKLFEELEGVKQDNTIIPSANESQKFWSDIWDNPVTHNKDASWLKELEEDLKDIELQHNIIIDEKKVSSKVRKIPNWKSPGPDGVQGYWLKNLTSLHQRIASQLNECLQSGDVPKWMTKGKTILCLKDVEKGNLVSNFRPITCLPLMWKLMTGILADEIYTHLEEKSLLPQEQKGGVRGSRGTKDQLLIDKMVLKNCKRRKTNLAMAWIDYKKAFDMVPHSWILKTLHLCKVALNCSYPTQ